MINTTEAWQKIDEVNGKETIITTFYGVDSQYYFTYESSIRDNQNATEKHNQILKSFRVLK